MGKDQIVKRSGKVAFMMIEDTCHRMRGFTELSKSRNAAEYSRKYVDEENERTDVIGYAEAISFNMDYFKGDVVHEAIISIFDEEKLGADAIVTIVTVDFSQGAVGDTYPAYSREYAVVPSNEGDSTDAYTYSGDFKASGKRVSGVATAVDGDWITCTFSPGTEVSTEQ